MHSISRLFTFTGLLIIFTIDGYRACFRNDEYHKIRVATGNAFYQECQCTEPGAKAEYIKWLDNNNLIITTGPGTDPNIFVESLSDSFNLHIRNITKSTSGTFKCIAQLKGQQYVQTFIIEAYDPLHFVNTSLEQYLLEGPSGRINCEPKGESEPFISWFKEDYSIKIRNDNKYQISAEGLIITDVTKEDEGNYTCSASLAISGESLDRNIKVKVFTKPVIRELKANPESRIVEGNPLSIDCTAEGMPPPEYAWNKISPNDIYVKMSTNITKQLTVKKIEFAHVTSEDQGVYQCIANNIAGNVTASITIEVLTPPAIINFDNIVGKEGDMVPIVCQATGQPEPNVTITRKSNYSNHIGDNVTVISPGAILRLRYLSSEGVYTCTARNEVGSFVKEMYVNVLHRPYLNDKNEFMWGWNEKPTNFTCLHDSNPAAKVTWRFKGNDITVEKPEDQILIPPDSTSGQYLAFTIKDNFKYGVYECEVENAYGKATKTITIREGFPPNAVVNISLTEVTATSILFSLEGPYDVTRPDIIGYMAEYDELHNFNITNVHMSRTWAVSRPFRLSKLKPNCTYVIRFAAINEVGTGDWSHRILFNTLDKSVPESPIWDIEEEQLRPTTRQVLKVKAPEDNGDPIDYYALRYCPESDPLDELLCTEETIKPTSEIILENLKSNTTYYLELVAHNSEGNSTAANVTIYIPALAAGELTILPAGAIIGIAIAIVIVCLILLDLLLLLWRRQGIMARCFCKKNEKQTEDLQARDKKGLLRENCESTDNTLKATNKGHKEYEYNKTTGIITGKHSAV